jgi:hypothetical protein
MMIDSPIAQIGLASEIASFEKMLNGDWVYKAPFLQRPFEWGEVQVGDMVGDLIAAFEGNYRYYFLGHIVVVRAGSGRADLVDGQQRLTTFTILLAYLRDQLASTHPALAERIQACVTGAKGNVITPRQSDAAFFSSCVQTPGQLMRLREDASADVGIEPATDAQALMLQAVRIVQSKMTRFANDPLALFAQFILERAVVDFIVAEDRSGAAILFRGMNMRGKPLSSADLIKSEMIESANLNPHETERAAIVWEEQEDCLGREMFAHLLEISPVLISGETAKRPGDLLEWRAQMSKCVKTGDFLIEHLPLFGGAMREIMNGEVRNRVGGQEAEEGFADVNRLLRGMMFLEERHWLAPAIVALTSSPFKPAFLRRYFRGLDRLQFACFLNAVRHEERPDRFAKVIRAGVDESQLFGKGNVFTLKPHEKRDVLQRLKEPFKRDGWRRRAIAFRANAALAGGAAFLPQDDVTLEHVLPQTFNEEWRKAGWTAEAHRRCTHLLGNFIVITKAQNADANGKSFLQKHEIYFGAPGTPIHAITKPLRELQSWSAEVVHARTNALIAALVEDWGLDSETL